MTQAAIGGPAGTVFPVASRARVVGHDAQRVFIVTDGRAAEGGPSQAIYYVSDAEIAAGQFVISGNKPIPIVEVGSTRVEYPPIAVYKVTATSPSDSVPPIPPPSSAPLYSSSEIGAVNAFTLDVTFDQAVSASDYAAGVTIKVNNVSQSISAAVRQTDHAIVNYTIPVLWHGSADTVTWEYAKASGNIVSEADATALENVGAQTVTNNVAWASLLDLQADMGITNIGGVSIWADQSGNGHDFTQSDITARPNPFVNNGYPAVTFDGVNDWLLGPDFADNPVSFTVTVVCFNHFVSSNEGHVIGKITESGAGNGWIVYNELGNLLVQQNDGSVFVLLSSGAWPNTGGYIATAEYDGGSVMHFYKSGALNDAELTDAGPITNYTTSEPVKIGTGGDQQTAGFTQMIINAIGIYSPVLNVTDRAALEARLAARYGVMYP